MASIVGYVLLVSVAVIIIIIIIIIIIAPYSHKHKIEFNKNIHLLHQNTLSSPFPSLYPLFFYYTFMQLLLTLTLQNIHSMHSLILTLFCSSKESAKEILKISSSAIFLL